MHGEKETTIAPRFVGTILHLLLVGVAAWIYFGGGIERIGGWFQQDWRVGNFARRLVLFGSGVILWCRLALTTFWLLRRRIVWGELTGILFAAVTYQIGFALFGATESAPLGLIDFFAIGLFLLGSYLNTGSEIQRKRFKDDPANQGKLYTQGLFRLARHINYFGDTLWVTGWAMLTRNLWAAIIPLALAAGFVFLFIPTLSNYLRQRYGEQFEEWEKKSKKFVPFVY